MKTHETDIPTYETPPQKKIRLPLQDEDCNRPQNHQSPSPRRPQSPIQISQVFSKKDRLLKRREFKRLSGGGRRLVGSRICIDWAKSSKGTRLGITATTHYGNAPERNRFKRLVREAFRLSHSEFPPHIDLNVLPRKLAKSATLHEIKAELCRLLTGL